MCVLCSIYIDATTHAEVRFVTQINFKTFTSRKVSFTPMFTAVFRA